MWKELKPALLITLVFTVLTGLIYPLAVTGFAQALFPRQANGSLVQSAGRTIGSELIAQNFTRPEYFHPRPSAAGSNGFDATSSGASNLGPLNPALASRLKKDAAAWRAENPNYKGNIPADAITTSGSGLDPEISLANAQAQSYRVGTHRTGGRDKVLALLQRAAKDRTFGVLGEPRVNVLELNLLLDKEAPAVR